MKIILANSNPIHEEIAKKCVSEFGAIVITKKDELTKDKLAEIDPDFVFFLHWSYIIPKEIYGNFNCILFHMTDLPYGRGGSPLQNLIVRDFEETKISAIKVAEGLDTGPVFMKRRLSLLGTAKEIFLRAGEVMFKMIQEIIAKSIIPVEQEGEVVLFKRRSPRDGDISQLEDLKKVYDYVRMLDCDGYPQAFLETKSFKFEFSRASLKKDYVICEVKISIK